MFEKDAEERVKHLCLSRANAYAPVTSVEYWKDGAEVGYNKAMKEWRDCFMSCSSPYCADKFRDIQCNGMLGNMTKEGKK